MLRVSSTPSFAVVAFLRSQVNSVPLSVMITRSSPCSLTIFFLMRLANCHASRAFEHGITGLRLVS